MRGPAARVLDWLGERLSAYSASRATWPATMAFVASSAILVENHDAARAIVGPLQEFSGSQLAVGALSGVFGSADRHLGAVQSMLGDPSATALLEGAVDQERRMGASLFTGYALAALGTHLGTQQGTQQGARSRGSRPGTEPLAEALEIARGLQLPRLRRLLGDSPDARPDGLTAREVEVLRLIAEGLSNRELARRLFISENTATNHVRSILMKTGSENRTQAATLRQRARPQRPGLRDPA